MLILLKIFGFIAACAALFFFEVRVLAKYKYGFFTRHSMYSAIGIVICLMVAQYALEYPKDDATHTILTASILIATSLLLYTIYRNIKYTNWGYGLIGSAFQILILVPMAFLGVMILAIFAIFLFVPANKTTKAEQDADDELQSWRMNNKDKESGSTYRN